MVLAEAIYPPVMVEQLILLSEPPLHQGCSCKAEAMDAGMVARRRLSLWCLFTGGKQFNRQASGSVTTTKTTVTHSDWMLRLWLHRFRRWCVLKQQTIKCWIVFCWFVRGISCKIKYFLCSLKEVCRKNGTIYHLKLLIFFFFCILTAKDVLSVVRRDNDIKIRK